MDYSTLPLFSLQAETREIPLTQGRVAIVDAADYDWLMQWKWYAHTADGRNWYARRDRMENWQRFPIHMHRVIIDAPGGQFVDHIDGDSLNNTRKNLRIATNRQNQCNQGVNRLNTSGYKGVTYSKDSKRRKRWEARIRISGKRISIGRFLTAEEAARAYDVAARKYHGEFARTNF